MRGFRNKDGSKLGFQKGHTSWLKGKHPEYMQGKNHFNWKNGKNKTSKEYIYIFSPNHPHKTKRKYVMEHRLIIEKQIGRFLKPKEISHHINEVKNDNRIENLMLFVNNGYHIAFHKFGRCNSKGIIFDGRNIKQHIHK